MSVPRAITPLSEPLSDTTMERNPVAKASTMHTPSQSSGVQNKTHINSENTNEFNECYAYQFTKRIGSKTYMLWGSIFMLFLVAVGNLLLTIAFLAILRLGQDLESMEFLPEHKAVKFFGKADLDHVYKRDGLLESFQDVPMSISSDNGSVLFTLLTRQSRYETKMVVNTSGVFAQGVVSLDLVEPDTGNIIFSTSNSFMKIPDGVNNVQAKQVSTYRIAAPVNEDMTLRSDTTAHLRGAEGTRLEAKEINWSADQNVNLQSINGSIILSARDGVHVDARYLPIAIPISKSEKHNLWTGQFKVCVCMPQGKLFRIAVPMGQKVSCSHINTMGDLNPCD